MRRMFEPVLQFGVGFAIALSGALIPGPLLAFVAMKTLKSGPKTGALAAIGHILVELGLLSLVAFGLKSILQSELSMRLIGFVGGVLLFIVGGFILVKARNPQSIQGKTVGVKHHPLTGGVLFSTVFNPSVFLWWMTVGLATLMAAIEIAGLVGAAFWLIGHFSADLIWFSTVSYSVHKGRELVGGTFYRGLLVACAFTLFIFGLYFVIKHLALLI